MLAELPSQIVGTSPFATNLREYLGKVARTDTNVLITGETGTGKELVATAIHRSSLRHSRAMISINCAALPDSLLESELFGYDRGAFTGAENAYAGKLRLAEGGTVCMDESGELSPYAQAKLLRALESRELFPLGARRPVRIDVRFIAATNQEIEHLVDARQFRRDLYYRLNVARLSLQPLREHREDLPALIQHYTERLNTERGTHVQAPTPELLSCLLAYEWPGNVRELRNLVEGVFIDPPAGPFGFRNIPEGFRRIFEPLVRTPPDERERLLEVLRATHWNKSRAAATLQWSRMTLYRKLSKYQIEFPPPPRG